MNEDAETLTEHERGRLDELLRHARGVHFWSFAVAGVTVALSAVADSSNVVLPLGNLAIPRVPAAVIGYAVTVGLVGVVEILLRMAMPFVRLDDRRPPFAWVLFSGRVPSLGSWYLWLVLPILLASFGSGAILGTKSIDFAVWQPSVLGLTIGGLFMVTLPGYVTNYVHMLRARADMDEVPISLSIYLHFIMRVVRQPCIAVGFFVPVFGVVEPWAASRVLWKFEMA